MKIERTMRATVTFTITEPERAILGRALSREMQYCAERGYDELLPGVRDMYDTLCDSSTAGDDPLERIGAALRRLRALRMDAALAEALDGIARDLDEVARRVDEGEL